MSLIATSGSGSTFINAPAGMHLARCYRIVDLGTQKSEFQGQIKHLQKIIIQFEIHGEDDAGKPLVTEKGEPMSISKNYTLSLADKANLRRDLTTWRGKEFTKDEERGFALKNLLGVWAMLSVIKAEGNNGKEYTNIASINPVPKAMKANLPEGHNEPKIYSITEHDEEFFQTFSNYIKGKIMESPEYQSRFQRSEKSAEKPKGASFDDMEDDIPFIFNVSNISDGLGMSKSLMRAKYGPKMLSILSANKVEF